MAEQGAKIAAAMVRRCHELDPTRVVSAAVNGDNEKGVSDALDIIGFNYNLKFPDEYHKKHPREPVYGSETSSAISTRGVYTDRSAAQHRELHTTAWCRGAKRAEEWWTFYGTREWEAGGFAWTGFDYRGEPTPYGWPSINSQFGIVDMCGFPKDTFLLLQGVVGQGAVAASVPALELGGQGRRRDSGVGVLEPGRSGAVGERQEPGQPESSAPGPRGVEGAVRAGHDRGARLERRQGGADREARDDGPGGRRFG